MYLGNWDLLHWRWDLTTGVERDKQFLKWEWDFFPFTIFNYII